jgi:RNA polymerase sigma factor (sigma-70 family)
MATPEQEEQFLLLIEQNKGIIYKIANSFKKDGEDKKDLVQEIIVQLWCAYPGFDGRSKISTWMYRVALNVAIASYRKDKKENEVMLPMHESILEFAEDDETDNTEGHLKLLQQFINEMKELDRALMLLYLEEKSGKEMAEILGLSETNIRTKINRLKEKIKHRFSQINN